MTYFMDWLRNHVLGRDEDIDRLIAANAARLRPTMGTVDWRKVDRAGAARWQQVLQGQRRQNIRLVHDRRR
jgi:hypothetical protein